MRKAAFSATPVPTVPFNIMPAFSFVTCIFGTLVLAFTALMLCKNEGPEDCLGLPLVAGGEGSEAVPVPFWVCAL